MRGDWFDGDDPGRPFRSGLITLLIGAGFLAFLAGRGGAGISVRTIIFGGAVILMANAFARTIGRVARRRRHRDPEVPEEVLDELDELRGRLLELEERADFSERLLAQSRSAEREPVQREEG